MDDLFGHTQPTRAELKCRENIKIRASKVSNEQLEIYALECRNGNMEHLTQVFSKTDILATKVIRGLLPIYNHQLYWDMLSVCHEAVYESLKKWRGFGAKFSTFYYQICYWRCWSWVHKNLYQRNERELLIPFCDEMEDDDELNDNKRQQHNVKDTLFQVQSRVVDNMMLQDAGIIIKECLSKNEYMAFILYLEGLTYTEIGEKMGKTRRFADNTLARAKDKLKNKEEFHFYFRNNYGIRKRKRKTLRKKEKK